jgi:hypothetical protein
MSIGYQLDQSKAEIEMEPLEALDVYQHFPLSNLKLDELDVMQVFNHHTRLLSFEHVIQRRGNKEESTREDGIVHVFTQKTTIGCLQRRFQLFIAQLLC